MMDRAHDTLARTNKGPMAPPPRLPDEMMTTIAETIASWPGVVATAHWDLYDSSRVDGIDFYIDEDELGHIHLDGSIHLAASPVLGKLLIAEGLASRFPFAKGWVQQQIGNIGTVAALALFRRNYDRIIVSRPLADSLGQL